MSFVNTLYYGDNLPILREHIADESIDLIYLDPPFNSGRTYNVLFKDESGQDSEAQIAAFDDTWHWNDTTEVTYNALVINGTPEVSAMMAAMRTFIGHHSQMMAYLVMMTSRLIELYRVLKPTGSLYLHCDPTASHYLKVALDTIFGPKAFRSEIIWKRSSAHSDAKKFANISDILLFYTKSSKYIWNAVRTGYTDEYIDHYYNNTDENGRRFSYDNLTKPKGSMGYFYVLLGCSPPSNGWRMPEKRAKQWLEEGRIEIPPTGNTPRYKRYVDELKGKVIGNIWDDIPPLNSQAKEALGYPTQKPVELLERIINASSNPGDTILDPFCGCGTTIAAAQKLGRCWVGIDITHLSIALQKYRLKDAFKIEPGKDYKVVGEPVDLHSAHQLANDDRYQFQWWALSLIQARPLGGDGSAKQGKKGTDKGIDGVINFMDGGKGEVRRVIVQVKSGNVKSSDIRDLVGTVQREKAAIGVFITLEKPTRAMTTEAVTAGFYHSPMMSRDYPKIQILSIEDLLDDAKVNMPASSVTFQQAPRETKQGEQKSLFD